MSVGRGRATGSASVSPGTTGGSPASAAGTGRQAARGTPVSPDASPADDAAIERARQKVKGPAIGLLVTGILSLLASPLVVLSVITFFGTFVGWAESHKGHAYTGVYNGGGFAAAAPSNHISALPVLTIMIAIGLVPLVLGGLMIFAGLKMKRFQAYGFAIAGGILAIVSPIFCIGLPIGIWALAVLSQRDVRAAFRRQRERATGSASVFPPGNAQHPKTNHPSTGGASGTPPRIFGVPIVSVRDGQRVIHWPGVCLSVAIMVIGGPLAVVLAYVLFGFALGLAVGMLRPGPKMGPSALLLPFGLFSICAVRRMGPGHRHVDRQSASGVGSAD